MVTSICGSSSRGVISVAKMPSSRATSASSGVMRDAWKAAAMRPEMPELVVVAAHGLLGRLQLHAGLDRLGDHLVAAGQAGQHFDLALTPTASPRRNWRRLVRWSAEIT
jgi:hypothetical protein